MTRFTPLYHIASHTVWRGSVTLMAIDATIPCLTAWHCQSPHFLAVELLVLRMYPAVRRIVNIHEVRGAASSVCGTVLLLVVGGSESPISSRIVDDLLGCCTVLDAAQSWRLSGMPALA